MSGGFEAELALDRLEAELAGELPDHVRAFASAYAAGRPGPAAPPATHRPSSIEVALRVLRVVATRSGEHAIAGVVDEELLARALALSRVLVPIAIEDDAAVTRTRAAPRGWEAWRDLADARDAAAATRFGCGHVELLHRLHGITMSPHGIGAVAGASGADWPQPLAGWHDRAPPIDRPLVERAWRDLADRHGARGRCRIVIADVHPRTFVIEPAREVTVVVGPITTPAARFAVLHELGHAVAALVHSQPLARVVDEAAAAYIARSLEHEGALDLAWFTPLAGPARGRRLRLCAALDAIERGAPERPVERPPWALWHDPAAQAFYVAAETLADRWWHELGATPPSGALAAQIAEAQRALDRAATVGR